MKNKTKFGVLALLASLACVSLNSVASALPSTLHWNYAGWSGGGAFPNIVPDPNVSGKVYIISDVAGIWASTNRGDQWNYITKGLVNTNTGVLAVSNSNSNVMYLGTEAGIEKTTDGGQNWVMLTATQGVITFLRPDNYKSIVVDRLDSNKVFAGNETGEVFFTTDGGATWNRVGSVQYPIAQGVSINSLYLTRDGTSLFAGSDAGLKRYDFGTGQWQSTSLPANSVSDMVGYGFTETLYVTYGRKVAYTTDKGATWQYSSDIPNIYAVAYRLSIATGAQGQTKIAVAWRESWNGGVYLSNDKGVNWTDIERNLNHDVVNDPTRVWAQGFGWPLSLNFDPNNDNTIYFSDFWGVWRTDDSGANWYEKIVGAGNTVGSDIAVASDGSLLVATMDNGLLKSTDNGTTYQALLPNATQNQDGIKGHIWRVVTRGSRIVATMSPWDNSRNKIAVSTDGGSTFTITSAGLPSSYPSGNTVWDKGYARALAMDPNNANRIYLGIDGDSGGGFFISDDGGSTWTRSAGQPGSLRIYNGLAVDPVETNRIYWAATGSLGGVYRSENSGQTWTKVFGNISWVFDLTVAKNGTVYAAGSGGGAKLYVSNDKGNTWSLLKAFPGSIYATCEAVTVDPNNPQRVVVGTVEWGGNGPNRIYMTEDGGANWTDISSDMPDGQGPGAMAFTPDSSALYATRYAGASYRMQLTAAGPDTIAPSAPTNLAAVLSGSQVNLSWSASADNIGVSSYTIYQSGTPLGTSTTTSFVHTPITDGATYNYTVKAKDAAGNSSAASNSVNFSVPSSQPADGPTNLSASQTSTAVNLAWQAPATFSAFGYNIYRNGVFLKSASSTTSSDSAVASGTAYSYFVRAYDSTSALSAASNTVSLTFGSTPAPDTTAPSAPGITQYSTLNGSADLSWTASTDNVGVTGYQVIRDGALVGTTTATSYTATGLTAGATYVFTVKAFDAAGNISTASNAVSINTSPVVDTTAPSAPTSLTAVAGASSISLNWNASVDNVGVASYQVIRNGNVLVYATATSYIDTTASVGLSYWYAVKAVDAAGNVSGASNIPTAMISSTPAPAPTPDTSAPSAPANFTAAAGASSINLSWTASTDNVAVTGYQVLRDGAIRATVTTTSYTDSTAVAGTSYSYLTKAIDAAGNVSAPSNSSSAMITASSTAPDTTKPSTPTNLSASSGSGLVNLAWTASTDNVGVTGYQVIRNGNVVANVATNSYVDSKVTVGSSYWYAVKAYDAANNVSSASNIPTVTVTTAAAADTTAPSAPAGLTATPGTASISLSWSSSTDNVGVTGYQVFRGGSMMSTVTATSFTDTSVTPGTAYAYTIKAVDAANNISAASNTASATVPVLSVPDTAAPSAPIGIQATVSGAQINVSWLPSSDNVGVTGYQVFRAGSLLATVTSTSYSDAAVTAGTAYTYMAKAMDAAGNLSASSISATATVPVPNAPDTTKPTAPTNLTAVAGTAQISLNWTASTDNVAVTGYQIIRSGNVVANVTTNSYIDTTATVGKSYWYAVKAYDAAGNISGASNIPTAMIPSSAAPKVLTVSASNITRNEAQINWTTDMAATGIVRMGEDPSALSMVSAVSPSGTSNSTIMYNLTRSRTYYYTVTVTNAGGASSTSAVMSFRTLSN